MTLRRFGFEHFFALVCAAAGAVYGCQDHEPVSEAAPRTTALAALQRPVLGDTFRISSALPPFEGKFANVQLGCSTSECLVLSERLGRLFGVRTTPDGQVIDRDVLDLGWHWGEYEVASAAPASFLVRRSSMGRWIRVAASGSAAPLVEEVPWSAEVDRPRGAGWGDTHVVVSCARAPVTASVLPSDLSLAKYIELPFEDPASGACDVAASAEGFLIVSRDSAVRLSPSGELLDREPIVFATPDVTSRSATYADGHYVVTWNAAAGVHATRIPARAVFSDPELPLFTTVRVTNGGAQGVSYLVGDDLVVFFRDASVQAGVRLDPSTLQRRVPGTGSEFEVDARSELLTYGSAGGILKTGDEYHQLRVPQTPGAPLVGAPRFFFNLERARSRVAPAAASDGQSFLVSWIDPSSNPNGNGVPELLARRYSSSSHEPVGEILVLDELRTFSASDVPTTHVAHAGSRYVVFWAFDGPGYVRTVSASGELQPTSDVTRLDLQFGSISRAALACGPSECLLLYVGRSVDSSSTLALARFDPASLTITGQSTLVEGSEELGVVAAAYHAGSGAAFYQLAWEEAAGIRSTRMRVGSAELEPIQTLVRPRQPPGAESLSITPGRSELLVVHTLPAYSKRLLLLDAVSGAARATPDLLLDAQSALRFTFDGEHFLSTFMQREADRALLFARRLSLAGDTFDAEPIELAQGNPFTSGHHAALASTGTGTSLYVWFGSDPGRLTPHLLGRFITTGTPPPADAGTGNPASEAGAVRDAGSADSAAPEETGPDGDGGSAPDASGDTEPVAGAEHDASDGGCAIGGARRNGVRFPFYVAAVGIVVGCVCWRARRRAQRR